MEYIKCTQCGHIIDTIDNAQSKWEEMKNENTK